MYNVEHIVKNNDAENTHPYGEFYFILQQSERSTREFMRFNKENVERAHLDSARRKIACN
jgi:hypothetical protein